MSKVEVRKVLVEKLNIQTKRRNLLTVWVVEVDGKEVAREMTKGDAEYAAREYK